MLSLQIILVIISIIIILIIWFLYYLGKAMTLLDAEDGIMPYFNWTTDIPLYTNRDILRDVMENHVKFIIPDYHKKLLMYNDVLKVTTKKGTEFLIVVDDYGDYYNHAITITRTTK